MGLFGDILGAAVGGLGSAFAGGSQEDAARAAYGMAPRPRPYPTHTSLGSTSAANSGIFTPHTQGKWIGQDLHWLRTDYGNRYKNFDREGFATRFLNSIDALERRREAQGFADYESKLFNQRGVSTGTGRMIADYQTDIDDARFRRAMQADLASWDIENNLVRNWQNAIGLQFDQHQQELNQIYAAQAGEAVPLGMNTQMAQAGMLAAGNTRAAGTQSFFNTLGGMDFSGWGGGGGGGYVPGGGFSANPFSSRAHFNRAGGSIF